MNNTAKITVISLIAVLVVAGAIFALTSKNDVKPGSNNSAQENSNVDTLIDIEAPNLEQQAEVEVLDPAEAGGVDLVEIVGDNEIREDFMTEAEKIEMGIKPSARVQVLARDDMGKILGYTILPEDAEPVTDIKEVIGLPEESAPVIESAAEPVTE